MLKDIQMCLLRHAHGGGRIILTGYILDHFNWSCSLGICRKSLGLRVYFRVIPVGAISVPTHTQKR